MDTGPRRDAESVRIFLLIGGKPMTQEHFPILTRLLFNAESQKIKNGG